MRRGLFLIAILLFGIGFDAAAATLSSPDPGAHFSKMERPRPRSRRHHFRRARRTGTYIPYQRNSVPIPYLRLSPAMRREANRRLLNALID